MAAVTHGVCVAQTALRRGRDWQFRSVLAFNHAMIFHSYAHVTSVVIHFSPLLLTYGLRWYHSETHLQNG
eukprot:5823740-Amphidinium_carterae.2